MELTKIATQHLFLNNDDDYRKYRRLTDQMYATLRRLYDLPELDDLTSCEAWRIKRDENHALHGFLAWGVGSNRNKGVVLFEKSGMTVELRWERFRGEVFITHLSIDFGRPSDGTAACILREIDEELRELLYTHRVNMGVKDCHNLEELTKLCKTW